jgi:aspartate/tyrosine/aromatic aminotransferase
MFPTFQQIPLDPIFQLLAEYKADKNPHKVNLGIGLYADDQGSPVVLDVIKKAFHQVDDSNFDYQPIGGNRDFLESTANLIFKNPNFDKLAMQATCGGTQSIRMMADLVGIEANSEGYSPTLIIGLPTWSNHLAIFKNFAIQKYEHLQEDGFASLENLKLAIELSPNKSVLLLHGGRTHNPSGQNLIIDQLSEIADLINQKEIKVFFDSAYFGFGDSFENDQEFLTRTHQLFNNFAVGFSYSKNASLYEHRTGALFIKTSNNQAVESQLQQNAREVISMAPGLGQEVMLNVLTNHLQEWQQEIDQIRQTLETRKQLLIKNLSLDFAYLGSSSGMFGLLPFSTEQLETLKTEHSIYLPKNGRINFAGVNPTNLDYLIEKFSQV